MIDVERISEFARFVREAVGEGAHFVPPPNRPQNPESWERHTDILLIYAFGKEEGLENTRHLSLLDVAEHFPKKNGDTLTKSGVSAVVTQTALDFWQNSSDTLKEQYPWERLKEQIGKPLFLTAKKGATCRKIWQDVEEGADCASLRRKYPVKNLCRSRQVLSGYGIKVPFAPQEIRLQRLRLFIEVLKEVGSETDQPTLQMLLGQVDYSFMVHHHRDSYDRYFTALTPLLRELGFHFDLKSGHLPIFLDRLVKKGHPYGQMTQEVQTGPQKGQRAYYFVFKSQRPNIEKDLVSDPELSRFLT